MLSDVVLPGLSGLDLVTELRRRDPAIAVVLVSGHSSAAVSEHGMIGPDSVLLDKPFTAVQLTAALDRAFALAARV